MKRPLPLIAALLACSPALAQMQYECIEVDAFANFYNLRETYLWDINESGMAPGLTTIANTLPGGSISITYTGFYWTPAGKTAVNFSDPRSVNDLGLIGGHGGIYDTLTQQITPMPPLAGWGNINLFGINNAGTAVGVVITCNCSNSNQANQIPYVWDPVNGARTVGPAGAKELTRINNSGIAVGNIRGNGADGFIIDLNTGATTTVNSFLLPSSSSSMVDINDDGVALGETASSSNVYPRAFLYTPGSGAAYLPPAPAGFLPDVKPRGLNQDRTVVGWISGTSTGTRAFVWTQDAGIRDLNTITSNIPAGFVLRRAMRINDQGWIVGDGSGGGGFSKGFVLRPISASCYANCDNSTGAPVLTANDFQCFINRYASGDNYANCDGVGGLTANDFACFVNSFAAGCP